MTARNRIFGLCLAVACAWSAPAFAQAGPLAELDVLADSSNDPRVGLQLAHDQIGEGDFIGAVATLERVLMDHPGADDALVLHASLLCRLDDRAGAELELSELRYVTITDQAWADVTAACGPSMRRPNGRGA